MPLQDTLFLFSFPLVLLRYSKASFARAQPLEMIQEFLNYSGIQVRSIRFDNAMEFGQSDHFKSWAKAKGAVLCPTVNYNHTLNSKSECYVRITKEHLRCMLLSSIPLDACGHLLCNISVESSGGVPRQMASHLGYASAWNVNSQLTWIEMYMLSAATALGIFREKVSSWETQPSTTVASRVRSL